jgi:hypothetical protein
LGHSPRRTQSGSEKNRPTVPLGGVCGVL